MRHHPSTGWECDIGTDASCVCCAPRKNGSAIRLLRRDARHTSLDSGEVFALHPQRAADDVAIAQLLGDAINEAIDDLSDTDQTLYHLCISQGLSYQKAADLLGVTHGVIRNRLSALRRTLRLKLATQQEGLS
jgi:RNA polymerase sigma-70 factor (ECF subfamily)